MDKIKKYYDLNEIAKLSDIPVNKIRYLIYKRNIVNTPFVIVGKKKRRYPVEFVEYIIKQLKKSVTKPKKRGPKKENVKNYLNPKECAMIFGVSSPTLTYWLRQYGLKQLCVLKNNKIKGIPMENLLLVSKKIEQQRTKTQKNEK